MFLYIAIESNSLCLVSGSCLVYEGIGAVKVIVDDGCGFWEDFFKCSLDACHLISLMSFLQGLAGSRSVLIKSFGSYIH